MYRLTLTQDERKAFTQVGDRYYSGNIMTLLAGLMEDGVMWSDREDITFLIPESIAWEINELARNDRFLWPCFSTRLVDKMNSFLESIV